LSSQEARVLNKRCKEMC